VQSLHVYTRNNDQYAVREVNGFKFVPLIGKMGWSTS
jgi:hypothetical protein